MRREKIECGCDRIFTLFSWNTCLNCGQEFRRERGYMKETGPYYGGKWREKYVCASCAGNESEADKVFDEHQALRMVRPPAPPAPPAPPPPQ